MTDSAEYTHLERIARDSLYAAGVNSAMVRYTFRVFSRFLRGASMLELGPAEGVMTDLLAPLPLTLTVVEGSESFCADLRARHPGITVVHSIFEDFAPTGRFDNIILGHVLEHVENPVEILRRCRSWLADGGQVLAAVPNARSIHRQAAVIMGMLPQEDAMNDMDRHHGHRRVFNPETFRAVFLQAGLAIRQFGGYWLKPVSNSQLEASFTPEMIDAFMQLGERYPDIAAELYVVANG